MGKYDDIINLPHHQSSTRPHMTMHDRAAQFAPFAALTGYDDIIDETERFVEQRIELDEQKKSEIDTKLRQLCADASLSAIITCYKPDILKEGGSYVRKIGKVNRFDPNRHTIDIGGEEISIYDIYDVKITGNER